MKYWKEGFYLEPIDGAVEISDQRWMELLDGQSQGLKIITGVDGCPALAAYVVTLDEIRTLKLEQITAHDCSDAVNGFYIDNTRFWLDKQTRTSMCASLDAAQSAGERIFTLWSADLPPVAIDRPIDAVRSMLAALEVYAKATYDATQRHKAAVCALGTVEEVEAYDYMAGYPNKLSFNAM